MTIYRRLVIIVKVTVSANDFKITIYRRFVITVSVTVTNTSKFLERQLLLLPSHFYTSVIVNTSYILTYRRLNVTVSHTVRITVSVSVSITVITTVTNNSKLLQKFI